MISIIGWKRCGFVPAFQAVYGGYTTMSGIMGWPLPNHTDPSLQVSERFPGTPACKNSHGVYTCYDVSDREGCVQSFQRGNLPSWRAYLAYQLVYGSLLSWEEIEDITFILRNSPMDVVWLRSLGQFRLTNRSVRPCVHTSHSRTFIVHKVHVT